MQIKKISINITEQDISKMLETVCKEVQSTNKSNNIQDLFTELLLQNTEASSQFVQIMLGNGLPEALRQGDVCRCRWERLKVGLTDADAIYEVLQENNLLNSDDEVTCKVQTFRGYSHYFPYVIEFKYGDNLYATASMGFEDVII